jgi:hypothetical protein
MQKNVVISENVFIQDLGTGFSYVNFTRSENEMTDEFGNVRTEIIAGEQYKVENPVTYEKIISEIIRERFTDDEREAALRKGIINSDDVDFIAFNEFAEQTKTRVRNEML